MSVIGTNMYFLRTMLNTHCVPGSSFVETLLAITRRYFLGLDFGFEQRKESHPHFTRRVQEEPECVNNNLVPNISGFVQKKSRMRYKRIAGFGVIHDDVSNIGKFVQVFIIILGWTSFYEFPKEAGRMKGIIPQTFLIRVVRH